MHSGNHFSQLEPTRARRDPQRIFQEGGALSHGNGRTPLRSPERPSIQSEGGTMIDIARGCGLSSWDS